MTELSKEMQKLIRDAYHAGYLTAGDTNWDFVGEAPKGMVDRSYTEWCEEVGIEVYTTDREVVTAYADKQGWRAPESTPTRCLFVKDSDWLIADFAGDHSAPGQAGMLHTLTYTFGGEEFGKSCTIAAGEALEMGYDFVDVARKWLRGERPKPGSRQP